MMTRKDYETLALALARARPARIPKSGVDTRDPWSVWADTVFEVKVALAADNPRFDEVRFAAAVVLPEGD